MRPLQLDYAKFDICFRKYRLTESGFSIRFMLRNFSAKFGTFSQISNLLYAVFKVLSPAAYRKPCGFFPPVADWNSIFANLRFDLPKSSLQRRQELQSTTARFTVWCGYFFTSRFSLLLGAKRNFNLFSGLRQGLFQKNFFYFFRNNFLVVTAMTRRQVDRRRSEGW